MDKNNNLINVLKSHKDSKGIDLFQHLCYIFGKMKNNPVK